MSFITSAAGMTWLLAVAGKAAVLLAASWVGALLLRRGAAAARHQMWTLGVVGALVLPVLCWLVPALMPAPSSTIPALAGTITFNGAAIVAPDGLATTVAAWPQWVAVVWAAGVLVVAVRLLRGHVAAHRLARRAEVSVNAPWTTALREAVASLGITQRIVLFRSETIGSPMTIGVLRARVLLPVAADTWSPERLRAVLVHELGHVRRRDTLIQLAAGVACALYWWNPLAWLAAARLRVEREHACDDLVLAAGVRPSSYATDLLDVARSIEDHVPLGVICMVDRSSTEVRLRRVLDVNATRRPVRARFRRGAAGVTVASLALLACTSAPPPELKSSSPGARFVRLSVGEPSIRMPVSDPRFIAPVYPPPARHGAIDLAAVAAEVNRLLPALEDCYEKRLADKPALVGTVAIHFVITETGEVPDQCITEDTVADPGVLECVNQLVHGGHFPAPRGGSVDVAFPFTFNGRATISRR